MIREPTGVDPGYRISVDTGGTFTDVVVADTQGRIELGKALTSPDRAFGGISAGLTDLATRLGHSLTELLERTDTFTYGTTRATNAVVEKKTAKTALLTTEGFPDILLLKEGGKPDPFKALPYPAPLIPRELTYEIRERVDADGSIYLPLDETTVLDALSNATDSGSEAVAVCLLWSIANPAHERRIGELIKARYPTLPYTLSHQLNPIVREYRRASSTAIDASLKPLMQSHLAALSHDLQNAGFKGHLMIATSYGGAWPTDEMIDKPIYSIGSGPSLGPVAARAYAEAEWDSDQQGHGTPDLLVCDTGGTTFDVGIVTAGEISYTNEKWLGGRWIGNLTGIRAVDVTSLGSGGGSLIWIDPGGLLRVGPQSAGSVPGPACYGRGGTRPTITDASVVLGFLDPDYFLGGTMKLDVDAARTALDEHVATPMNMSVEQAAWAALVVATEDIIGAIRETTIARGVDPREVTIVAGGGASGLNMGRIGSELGCSRVLLPRTAGALSACGGLHSNIVSEYVTSYFADTGSWNVELVEASLSDVGARARAFLDSLSDIAINSADVGYSTEARYHQQVWELDLSLRGDTLAGESALSDLEEDFHTLHEKIFAVRQPGAKLECLSWKARATAVLPKPAIEAADRQSVRAEPATHSRTYFDGREYADTPNYNGAELPLGTRIVGPAIVREPTTTIVVYPELELSVTGKGNYLLQRHRFDARSDA